MPRWVKTDFNSANSQRFAMGEKSEFRVGAHSESQQLFTRLCGEILLAAPASVVRVRMCDNGASYGRMGINVEITRNTVQTLWGGFQEIAHENTTNCFLRRSAPMSSGIVRIHELTITWDTHLAIQLSPRGCRLSNPNRNGLYPGSFAKRRKA